jgi:trimethylamine--corrinoid protein Co-methyltransferase
LRQSPWQQAKNPYPPLCILSADEIEAIHETSLRVLEELGIELMSAPARELLASVGADVDDSTGLVKLDRGLVAEMLVSAPSSFTLVPRNADKRLESAAIVWPSASWPGLRMCTIASADGERETYRDCCDFIRLAQHFDAIPPDRQPSVCADGVAGQ